MPYSLKHKQRTRIRVVEAARVLFNRHGFENVSIDDVMAAAGLTRGGFYNHFKNKEELFAEAVASFLMGRGAQWRHDAGINGESQGVIVARQMIDSYLSSEHLGDLEGQCPMIALPSDVGRANASVRESYQSLLEAMVSLFETNLPVTDQKGRQKALSLAALCVGGMVLARTLSDSALAQEVRSAACQTALEMTEQKD